MTHLIDHEIQRELFKQMVEPMKALEFAINMNSVSGISVKHKPITKPLSRKSLKQYIIGPALAPQIGL